MNHEDCPDVIGIGACTADMLFVVPQLPVFGQSMRASQYLRQSGGPVATALVTLARLGVSTRFIGRVGDDPEGVFIREEFRKEGVDVSRLMLEPNVSYPVLFSWLLIRLPVNVASPPVGRPIPP